MSRATVAAVAVSMAAVSCDEPTVPLPQGTPGFTIVSLPLSDTVFARPNQPIVIQVFDSTGTAAVGRTVQFRRPPAPYDTPALSVAALGDTLYGSSLVDTTDATGTAGAMIRPMGRSGEARLVLAVPELGLEETVLFNILPGSPMRTRFSIRDTVILVGGAYAIAAHTEDVFGNLTAAVPNLVVASPGACSLTGSVVTGTTMARCIIVGEVGLRRDTARASVVPNGRLAVRWFESLALASLDAADDRVLFATPHASLAPAWSPDGGKLVIYEGDPSNNALLSIIDTNGVRLASIGGGDRLSAASNGRFSADGQYVYFSGRTSASVYGSTAIYRMPADGSELDTVVVPQTYPLNHLWRPTISPDGKTVAFDAQNQLYTADVTDGTPVPLNTAGIAPSFSPDGLLIAFLGPNGDGLKLMNRDGSNARTLATGHFSDWSPPQWTSDGQWLLAESTKSVFVHVASGERVPLVTLPNHTQSALKPPFGR